MVENKEEQIHTEETNKQNKELNIWKEVFDFVIYLISVFVVVWLIITFVGERTIVNGVSMYDTLDDGDNLWTSKISYRLHDPERFDIVIFPHVEEDGQEKNYIKRIIGMPGETVRIDEDGNIYINGKILEESYGYEPIDEDMIGRAGEEITLGDDEYFVMGDNRNNSMDSREEEVGNIHRDELIGKAVFRMWPLRKIGTID